MNKIPYSILLDDGTPTTQATPGLISTYGAANAGRMRRYINVSNAATVGDMEYATSYNCSINTTTGVWAGRDVADICWLEKWSTAGSKEYWYTATAVAGTVPTWIKGQGFNSATGNTDLVSVNSGQVGGFRNKIINGDFSISQINQGTVTGNMTNMQYCMDTWQVGVAGTGATAQQVVTTHPDGTGNTVYELILTGNASNTGTELNQRIEAKNSYFLAGKTVAVSCWMIQSTGSTKALTTRIFYETTTADTFTTMLYATSNSVNLPSGVWSKMTFIITIPATATKGIQMNWSGVGALLGGQGWGFVEAQLEQVSPGATQGTAFEHVDYGIQLARCQRYLPLWRALSNTDPLSIGQSTSATTALIILNHPVTSRTLITGIVVSASNIIAVFEATGTGTTPTTGIVPRYYGSYSTTLELSGLSGLVSGQACACQFRINGAYIYGTGAQL